MDNKERIRKGCGCACHIHAEIKFNLVFVKGVIGRMNVLGSWSEIDTRLKILMMRKLEWILVN